MEKDFFSFCVFVVILLPFSRSITTSLPRSIFVEPVASFVSTEMEPEETCKELSPFLFFEI